MFPAITSLIASAALLAAPATALLESGLTHEQVGLVRQRLVESAHVSWEYGAAVQAILELDYREISVFGSCPYPPPYALNASSYPIQVAQDIANKHPYGLKSLMDDGAAGDPASNGISIMLANWTFPGDSTYYTLMQNQLHFLEYDVPHTGEGAWSHRRDELQLWADYVFMVPPIAANWGALHADIDVEIERKYLIEAWNQCRVYRDYLRDPNANNVWRHIVLGPWSDPGYWATGQGWAAYGMLRVYQTIAKSTLRDELGWALGDLAAWIEEIVAGTWTYQQADGSLNNYIDRGDSFKDMSGTAFMAAVTYRLGMITDISNYVGFADKAFELVKNSIDGEGWLYPVVDPYTFSVPGTHSPEGQAMVLMLQAAYRDYQSFGKVLSGSLSDLFGAFAEGIAAAKDKQEQQQQQ